MKKIFRRSNIAAACCMFLIFASHETVAQINEPSFSLVTAPMNADLQSYRPYAVPGKSLDYADEAVVFIGNARDERLLDIMKHCPEGRPIIVGPNSSALAVDRAQLKKKSVQSTLIVSTYEDHLVGAVRMMTIQTPLEMDLVLPSCPSSELSRMRGTALDKIVGAIPISIRTIDRKTSEVSIVYDSGHIKSIALNAKDIGYQEENIAIAALSKAAGSSFLYVRELDTTSSLYARIGELEMKVGQLSSEINLLRQASGGIPPPNPEPPPQSPQVVLARKANNPRCGPRSVGPNGTILGRLEDIYVDNISQFPVTVTIRHDITQLRGLERSPVRTVLPPKTYDISLKANERGYFVECQGKTFPGDGSAIETVISILDAKRH